MSQMPDPAHVGFTGTRNGMTPAQAAGVAELIRGYGWLHHGDCIGSDFQAHGIAGELGMRTESHPPSNPALRAYCKADIINEPKPYLDRDRDIVDATCRLIAAPAGMTEELRSGTWTTVRYARRIGRPVVIVFADGSVQGE